MKRIIIILVMVVLGLEYSNAQQLPQFTQYMYNTISVNPAYAGSRDALSIVGLNRNQWAGFDGGPQTQTLSIHSPLRNEKIGLGLSLLNDKSGYENFTYIYGDFSYTIKIADFFFEDTAFSMLKRIKNETNVTGKIKKISDKKYRVFLGPYSNINSLQKSFNSINILEFDNIEIIKND